jgi:hypothetical protein
MTVFEKFCSQKNLKLAWRRIQTGSNNQYKRFFRDLYYAYGVADDQNIKDLRTRLLGGSYKPEQPTRVYIPKSSGLQRPITLLSIEDQIVWQAVANLFANKLRQRRKNVELDSVFSNILQADHNGIFFVHDWHYSYGLFQDTIEKHFKSGNKWIAHFDLAAFYDTICHELLLKMLLHKHGNAEFRRIVSKCLRLWSSHLLAGNHSHGIPQGPIASNFMSECFLLSIDETMSKEFHYVRYVDDIRIFGKSETEVRKAGIKLEILCRERGLIPQGKKYVIKEANTLQDAMGSLPSIQPQAGNENATKSILPKKTAIRLFKKGLSGKPKEISDKSRIRYVLFNSDRDPIILTHVLKLLPHYPEHIDAFAFYLSQYKRSRKIIAACKLIISKTPYEYVQGELWHILTKMVNPLEMKTLVKKAVKIINNGQPCFMLKWGIGHFLCKAESYGIGKYVSFLPNQEDYIKSLLVPVIPDHRYAQANFISKLLKSNSYEPGLMLTDQFIKRNLAPRDFGVRVNQIATQAVNVFKSVGLIKSSKTLVDPMAEILVQRFRIKMWRKWNVLFGSEYFHALHILSYGDPLFDSGKSEWLKYQNSFNHALFIAFQKVITQNNMHGAVRLVNRQGKSEKYGVLLDQNGPFGQTYPNVAKNFKDCNDRRNALPASHPYQEKTGQRANWLTVQEQNAIVKKLKQAYTEIIIAVKNVV